MRKTQKTITKFLLLVIAFTFALSSNYLFAVWSGPTQAPPGGNTPTPIHVGSTAQVKNGGLSLNALAVFGNGWFQGGVRVGNTTNANAGAIRFTGTDFEGYMNGNWVSFTATGGGGGGGGTTKADCDAAGGSWEAGQSICYFETRTILSGSNALTCGGTSWDDSTRTCLGGLACPTGWIDTGFNSTKASSCSGGVYYVGLNPACTTQSHTRKSSIQESCEYSMSNMDNWGQISNVSLLTCYATLSEIGCTKNSAGLGWKSDVKSDIKVGYDAESSMLNQSLVINDIAQIKIDAGNVIGNIKSLLGTAGGPWDPYNNSVPDQNNLFTEDYKDIGIDFIRTYDNERAGRMEIIFPDLNADSNDPASYDFATTDLYIKEMVKTGSEIMFSLAYGWPLDSNGNQRKLPFLNYISPNNYDKWADIAKHIVMHYNDGWKNGFNYNIKYWEIWNEPNNDTHIFWSGTNQEFFNLYEKVAKKLKNYNSNLKIGGPALAIANGRDIAGPFARAFLSNSKSKNAPLDFFSYHLYPLSPIDVINVAGIAENFLSAAGYNNSVELFLTEYNFPWGDSGYTGQISQHAAATFVESSLIYMQDSGIDRAVYFTGNTHGILGMFKQNKNGQRLPNKSAWRKEAFALKAYNDILIKTPVRIKVLGSDNTAGYAVLAGKSNNNKQITILISDFNSKKTEYTIAVNNLPWGKNAFKYERYVIDANNNLDLIETQNNISGSNTFTVSEKMEAPSIQMIKLTAN